MDLSGNRGELPIPMHAANASSYGVVAAAAGHGLELQHNDGHAAANHNGQQSSSQMAQLMPSPLAAAAAAVPVVAAAGENAAGIGKKRAAAGAGAGNGGGGVLAVKYRECLKNHAAAIGGNATDGCGEFMPSGVEGSLEALKCSACGCHRNFHRKDLDDDFAALDIHRAAAGRRLLLGPHSMRTTSRGGLLVSPNSGADHYGSAAYTRAALPPPPPHQIVMPLNMIHSSESDEMDGVGGAILSRSAGHGGGSSSSQQKRFRTKFTPEQKARMLRFAETAGWRIQRLEDAAVQRFCQEIGVKRRVLKVWMHNNKHNLATKQAADQLPYSTPPASPQPQPQAQAQALPLQPMNSMPPPSQEPGPSSSPPPQDDQLNLE